MFYGYTPQQPQQQPIGRWLIANSYQEIENALIPMDGSQTVFMMSSEPVFYVVSILNGQKYIQGYKFTALTADEKPKKQMTVEDRLATLEDNISKMAMILEGVKGNESNLSDSTADNVK